MSHSLETTSLSEYSEFLQRISGVSSGPVPSFALAAHLSFDEFARSAAWIEKQ